MIVGELMVLIAGNNAALSAALAKSEAEMKGFEGSTATHAGGAANHLHGLGVAAGAVAAGTALFGIEATKSAAEFHSSMELVHTQAGATQKEVDSMTGALLRLSPAVATGPQNLSEGLFHLEGASFRGEAALHNLTIAAEGAKIGHASLEDTTNALNATLVAGIPGIHSAEQAMGGLNAVVGSGDMRLQDLNEALGTGVLAAVKGFGVTFQDVGAALATFGDNNIRGADAATQLRLATMFLAQGTAHADDALNKIGLSTQRLRNDLASGGLNKALTDLHDHFEKHGVKGTEVGDTLLEAFGKKAGVGLSVLVGQFDRFQSKFDEVDEGAKRFGEDWAATMQEASFKGDQAGASIESIVDSVGLGLLPAVGSLFDTIQPVLTSFADWASHNQKLAATILIGVGAVAALVAGIVFLGPILGAIGGALAVITSPITLLVGGILALAAHFGLLGDGAKSFVDGAASSFLDWIGQVVPQVLSALGEFAQGVLTWIGQQAPAWLAQLGTWAQAFVSWVGPMIPVVLSALAGLVGQLVSWIAAQAPGWLAQLGKWAEAFAAWVGPLIPKVLGELAHLATNIVQWIVAQLPAIGAWLGKWGGEFVAWVIPQIPVLLGNLAGLIVQVGGWVLQQIPVLAGELLKWGASFIGWVAASIPGLVAALGQWFASMLAWMGTIPGKVFDAASAWGKSIADGIIAGIGDIGKAVGDKLNTIPGVSLVGQVGANVVGVAQGAANVVTGNHAEGVWNVAQDHAALIHAGEMVVPENFAGALRGAVTGGGSSGQSGGGGGGSTTVHRHIHIELGGRELKEWIETEIFNNASAFSSGFAGAE